jgi:hypothetical protein
VVCCWSVGHRIENKERYVAPLVTGNACLRRHKRRACNDSFIRLRYIDFVVALSLTCNECFPYPYSSRSSASVLFVIFETRRRRRRLKLQ